MSTPRAAAGDRGSLSPSKSPERGAPRRKEAYHVAGRPAADEDDEGSIYVYMSMPQAQVRAPPPPRSQLDMRPRAPAGLRTTQGSAVQACAEEMCDMRSPLAKPPCGCS